MTNKLPRKWPKHISKNMKIIRRMP